MLSEIKEIYLAGGCFWGLDHYLSSVPGVQNTQVGYANGKTEHPSYQDVCYQNTGHAETVKVEYNSSQIDLTHLLSLYFEVIDPVSVNRQGNDIGTQYRTGIYFVDSEDEPVISTMVGELQKKMGRPLAIEVSPLQNYYPAEEYHQKYLVKNPGGYCHISGESFEKAHGAIVNPSHYSAPEASQLKTMLSDLSYQVTQQNGTEPAYHNEYYGQFSPGVYVDVVTGEPLFSSADKFDACGWPSFSKPIDPSVIRSESDLTHGMIRQEVRSRVGNIHLGHVFDDGPSDSGGLRYCINSASLRFIPKEEMEEKGYGKFLYLVDKDQ